MIAGFKPNLFPSKKPDLDKLNYPMLASLKLDGIRCIFIDGKMLSRSLKEINNKQLQERFQHIKDYSSKHDVILDGEIYGTGMTFQEVTHFVMSSDIEVPDKLKFFCFDILKDKEDPFTTRLKILNKLDLDNLRIVNQTIVNSREDVEQMFERALDEGYEGLILKSKESLYKFGRYSPNSGDGYKVKPFLTFDAEIISVEERFLNTNESETNELGRSFKRNTVDNKEGTGIAATFTVIYEGLEQKVTITGLEEFRKEIWENKESYIGKMIEFKGMLLGSKEKVRHPVFVRFRGDRE